MSLTEINLRFMLLVVNYIYLNTQGQYMHNQCETLIDEIKDKMEELN